MIRGSLRIGRRNENFRLALFVDIVLQMARLFSVLFLVEVDGYPFCEGNI